jgi:putrescine aminotransferase
MNHIDKGAPKSQDAEKWRDLDRRHHLHPFTDTKALNAKGARIITRGEGCYIVDADGKKLLDGMAGLWCVNLGYNRRELVEAAANQLSALPYYNNFFSTANTPSVELAARLAAVTPEGLDHIFFANSGSEAIDTAMRMVRYFWQAAGKPEKTWLIARDNAYHGSTIAATSLGGQKEMRKQALPLLGDIAHVAQPYHYGEGDGMSEDEFGLFRARLIEEKILEIGPERVAAVFGEPIQGAGGVIVPPKTYWPEVERICRKYDVLLVADEVICGFGRTGAWFGCQTFGFAPDLITMAKGMSSGYLPISGVAVGRRVADMLIENGGEFYHGFTYSGHPASAAVALATLDIMQDEKLVERVRDDIGPYFQNGLRTLLDHPLVGHIDGIGLIAGIALVKGKSPKKFFETADKAGLRCRDHSIAHGLMMRAVGDRMALSPPLVISHEEVDDLVRIVRRALDLTLAEIGGV